jgi:UDP-N-acetylglucosamine 2-epimerase
MATLHFVATDDFAIKLAPMGIDANAVTVSGAPGLDGIEGNSARRDRNEVLVTYHPETRLPDYGVAQCGRMLEALGAYYRSGCDITFCGVNNDPGSDDVKNLIEDFCGPRSFAQIVTTMNHREYIEKMQRVALVVGNSSAGVIEAPWIGVPSINIGDRQKGRPMASSVYSSMDCIAEAITHDDPWEPIYRGGAAKVIAAVIKDWRDGAR